MIEKNLKDFRWTFNDGDKSLGIYDKRSDAGVSVDQLRIYSLARFIIRVCQRLSRRRKGKR